MEAPIPGFVLPGGFDIGSIPINGHTMRVAQPA